MNVEIIKLKYERRLIYSWVFIFFFFILYNVVTKNGLFPKVFGGFYTFSIALAFLSYFKIFFIHIKQNILRVRRGIYLADIVDKLFFIFLGIFFFSILFGYITKENPNIVEPLSAAFFRFVALYLMCLYIRISSIQFYKINYVCFALATFLLAIYYLVGGNDYVIKIAYSYEVDDELNYQGVALAYVLISMIGINYIKHSFFRFAHYALSSFILLLVGARSEFVLLVIVMCFHEVLFTKKNLEKILNAAIIGFFILFATGIYHLMSTSFGYDTRMDGLLNMQEDESMLVRSVLNDLGYETIMNNIFFGSFASYAPGQYMHNIFSAWVDLGFLGFFSLTLVFFISITWIVRRFLSRRFSIEESIASSLLIGCFVLLVFAKSYFYILIPVSIGLFVNAFKDVDNERVVF